LGEIVDYIVDEETHEARLGEDDLAEFQTVIYGDDSGVCA
jgi:hypothetical protein